MTSGQDKCGLGSLLPMSCQDRAEAFARRLHSKLRSLSSSDTDGDANESSWLTLPENAITAHQPRQTDPDLYFDFGDTDSPPGSPEEEADTQDSENIINEDSLQLMNDTDCSCSSLKENYTLVDSFKTTALYNNNEKNLNESNCLSQIKSTGKTSDKQNKDEIQKVSQEIAVAEGRSIDATQSVSKPSSCIIEDTLAVLNLKGSFYSDNIDKESDSPITDKTNSLSCLTSTFNENGITFISSLSVQKEFTVNCPYLQIPEEEEGKNRNRLIPKCTNENDDDTEELVPRVRRCSSLKTGKTPPGTPGRKKIVRFADVLGLDLADVRTFLDEIPKIPNSAYNDLKEVDLNDSPVLQANTTFESIKVDRVLVPLFQQPGGRLDFIDRVRQNEVCLENALVEDPVSLCINGTIRVKNLDFHKSVYVRYTMDSWDTFSDVQATYVDNSCDGFSDKFYFKIFANNLQLGQKLELAIRFHCKGCQFWDSNDGVNYCFQCLPPAESAVTPCFTEIDENWSSSLYY